MYFIIYIYIFFLTDFISLENPDVPTMMIIELKGGNGEQIHFEKNLNVNFRIIN